MNRHLTWEQISDYLIGQAAAQQARHAQECVSCHAEVARLESSLSEFRSALRQWIGRMSRTDFQTLMVTDTGAGAHLDRLLMPASLELPWYRSLLQNIALAIHPRKLPPLELTSKPVAPAELKGLSGLYAGNETRAGLGSLAVHAAMIALLLLLGSLKPVLKAVKVAITLVAPPLPAKVVENKSGGGSGGARQPMAKKADPPKPVRQFVPPPTVFQTRLSMPVSFNANVPDVDLSVTGAQIGLNALAGGGPGGGFGGGPDGGFGNGPGPGVGSGTKGGSGDHGVYRAGAGITNPVAIYKPEPQYSEEARKAKWQGSVLLSLVVDESGKPTQIRVVRSLGLGLDEKAIQAVSQWKFTPGKKDGKQVPVAAQIEVTFRLL